MDNKFAGNGVFLQNGKSIIPAGTIAERLMAGDFGPHPNASAPPGFRIPEIVQALQGSQTAAVEAEATKPEESWIDALNRYNAYKQMQGTGSAGYFGAAGKGVQGTPAWEDLQKIRAVNPNFGFPNPIHDGGF